MGGIGLAVWALSAVGRDGPGAPRRDAPESVLVYQLRRGARPYELASYAPFERRIGGDATTEDRLRMALQELVKGTNQDGVTSSFSTSSAGLVESVSLSGGRAVVDLGDLDAVPGAATSEGGTAMLYQLNLTVFQFPSVQEVEYRMEGSCDAFWRVLESTCRPVTREDFARAP